MSTLPSAFVTESEVHVAANALTGDGLYPSVLAVRRRLGNRGSATTLSKHLRSWRDGPGREALAQVIAPAEGGPQDPEIEALLHLHPRVVDKLRAQVEGRFRAQVAALEAALATVRDETDAQAQAAAEALAGRESAEARATGAVAQVGVLAAELAALRQGHAAEVASARAALQAASDRVAALERELGAAQGSRRVLEGVVGERDHQLAQLRADLAAAQAGLREAERRIDADLAQLAALRESHAAAEAAIAGLRERLDEARRAAAVHASERDQALARCTALERAIPASATVAESIARLSERSDRQAARLGQLIQRAARQRAAPRLPRNPR